MSGKLICLALCCGLLLSGCSSMLERTYSSRTLHVEQSSTEEDPSILRAESYQTLINDLLYFIEQGQETGTIRLYQYPNDVGEDLEKACVELLTEDPLGAYALSDIDREYNRIVSYYECTFTFHYQHTLEEINSIVSVTGSSAIRESLAASISDFSPSLVLRTSSYYARKDLITALIRQAYYTIPTPLGLPQVELHYYPETGSQQIVELLFQYPYDQSVLQAMSTAATDALSDYLLTVDTQTEDGIAALITRLQENAQYSPEGEASIYAALVSGYANSEGMALAFYNIMDLNDIPCLVVEGTMEDEPHWWNMIQLDNIWWHVDVTAPQEDAPLLLSDAQAEQNYSWDRTAYPVCGPTASSAVN